MGLKIERPDFSTRKQVFVRGIIGGCLSGIAPLAGLIAVLLPHTRYSDEKKNRLLVGGGLLGHFIGGGFIYGTIAIVAIILCTLEITEMVLLCILPLAGYPLSIYLIIQARQTYRTIAERWEEQSNKLYENEEAKWEEKKEISLTNNYTQNWKMQHEVFRNFYFKGLKREKIQILFNPNVEVENMHPFLKFYTELQKMVEAKNEAESSEEQNDKIKDVKKVYFKRYPNSSIIFLEFDYPQKNGEARYIILELRNFIELYYYTIDKKDFGYSLVRWDELGHRYLIKENLSGIYYELFEQLKGFLGRIE